jgi:simple sugar transport system permease protein
MAEPQPAAGAADDERVKEIGGLRNWLIRPELGGIVGTIAVFVFFGVLAGDSGMFNAQGIMNWSVVSAQFMIIAVGACMLMVAGEFDLSVGSMIGFAGISIAMFGVVWGLPMWVAILITFALCISIGALNGFIVVRTGLPSFIVTLAFLFILRGFTIFIPQTVESRTIIGGIEEAAEGDWLASIFATDIMGWLFVWLADIGWVDTFTRGNREGEPVISGIPMLIIWALVLVVIGHLILTRTRFGNWIFAAGGDAQAARYVAETGGARLDCFAVPSGVDGVRLIVICEPEGGAVWYAATDDWGQVVEDVAVPEDGT